MSTNNPAPAAEHQPETIEANLAAARAEGTAAGHAEGLTAGAAAERTRFAALAELDAGSAISAGLAAAVAEGTSVADFALAQARDSKTKLAAAAAAAKTEAVPGAELPASGALASPGAPPEANRGAAFVESRKARQG